MKVQTKVSKTMIREVIKNCRNQMKLNRSNPFSAIYMGAKFNYFYAIAKLNNEVEKRFRVLENMYVDFHTQAEKEGWQPKKLTIFE